MSAKGHRHATHVDAAAGGEGSVSLQRLIDASAEGLRAGAPAFTARNLRFAVRRALGAEVTDAKLDAALRRRLARGPLPGLLPVRRARASRKLPSAWDAAPPTAVLLVDRPAILDLFLALAGHDVGGRGPSLSTMAVVCIDGTPKPVVAWLSQSCGAWLRAPVLYLHDAATVVYPFSLEPLATRMARQDEPPMVYRDLGLSPGGSAARRFGDPALPSDELILELEAIPPAALLRYVAKAAV